MSEPAQDPSQHPPKRPSKAARERWAHLMASAWRHPKFLGCDPDAVALWCMGLSWSMDAKTDGFIPAGAVPMILSALKTPTQVSKAIKTLLTRKLWDRGADGYKVHDFTDYNPTDEYLEFRRDAGRKAAEARWSHSKSNADRNADRIADGNTEVEVEEEGITPPSPPRKRGGNLRGGMSRPEREALEKRRYALSTITGGNWQHASPAEVNEAYEKRFLKPTEPAA